jgi:hypothetical protein
MLDKSLEEEQARGGMNVWQGLLGSLLSNMTGM